MYQKFILFFLSLLMFENQIFAMNVKHRPNYLRMKAKNPYPVVNYDPTNFTPKKDERKMFSLDFEALEILDIEASLNGQMAHLITSDRTDFTRGILICFNVMYPRDSLAVDANNPLWNYLILKLNARVAHLDQRLLFEFDTIYFELLLMELNYFLDEHIGMINEIAIQSLEEKKETVCRHYSTYMAILFSKFFAQKWYPWHANNRQIAADELNSKLEFVDFGHVWNFISVSTPTRVYFFLFDPHHFTIVRFDPSLPLAENSLFKYKNNIISGFALFEKPFHLGNAVLSLDMMVYSHTDINSLYHPMNKELRRRLSLRLIEKHKEKRINRRVTLITDSNPVKRKLFSDEDPEWASPAKKQKK